MARYIDADLLLEQLNRKKSEIAKGRCTDGFNDAIMRVRSMISTAPTADVVSKSEYERLEKLFNDMTQEAKGYLNRLHGIRSDVAREIFEEIDELLSPYGTYIKTIELEEYAELKKKYMEDKTNEIG